MNKVLKDFSVKLNALNINFGNNKFNYIKEIAIWFKVYLENLEMSEKYLNLNKNKMEEYKESKEIKGINKELIEENVINRRDEKIYI